MDDCCVDKACAVDSLRRNQASILRIVLFINAAMFVVELVAGLVAGSVALLADSLDMLGDALIYGFSLYVVGRGPVWEARAAMSKAAVMGLFGMFVLGQLIYRLVYLQPPVVEAMSAVGFLALIANGMCFGLLWRHRADDINMRSVWLCSRNDLFANVAVLTAAGAVWITVSAWPDIAVGALICALFLRSSLLVAREARAQLRSLHSSPDLSTSHLQDAKDGRTRWSSLT